MKGVEPVPLGQEAPLGSDAEQQAVCQHHWLIDKPSGAVSKGVCRLCGQEREFQNYVEGSAWGSDISLEQLSGGSRLPSGLGVGAPSVDPGPGEDA